jgi:hypothetical protein
MALNKTAKAYTAIDLEQEFDEPTDIYNRAANWSLAGLDDSQAYRLSAADQRRLLGFVVGKGRVLCDWERGLAFNVIQVCFGTDTDYSAAYSLKTGVKVG